MRAMTDAPGHPHRRLNPLTGDWVLVSPHRLSRPWQGATTRPAAPERVSHDPGCYLCPGNARAGGVVNPAYGGVYVFDNDFPALLSRSDAGDRADVDGLLVAEPETGVCRVICYSPAHDLAFAGLAKAQAEAVVVAWSTETEALMSRGDVAAVTIFENRGAMMGASNPHPHGQIWATSSIPQELRREAERQRDYHRRTGRPLLADYLDRETRLGERIVVETEGWVALVPFWAAWPFELLVLSRRPVGALTDLTRAEQRDLAGLLQSVGRTYDAVFDTAFPYTFGWHQRPKPAGGEDWPGFGLHAHFYPPLLRSADVRKYMVGFEMLGTPQRDITPESAADTLRRARDRAAGR
ncbi:UDP-glucose--hexose-1-phosphate uridylyltransferase [bacterium]|nr:UDP-glucose--hexose-1-phosphate uridylyltransferase [bacterium]